MNPVMEFAITIAWISIAAILAGVAFAVVKVFAPSSENPSEKELKRQLYSARFDMSSVISWARNKELTDEKFRSVVIEWFGENKK
jgi:hypothetical protein